MRVHRLLVVAISFLALLAPSASAEHGCPKPGPLCVDPMDPIQNYVDHADDLAMILVNGTTEFVSYFGVLTCDADLATSVPVLDPASSTVLVGASCRSGEPTLP